MSTSHSQNPPQSATELTGIIRQANACVKRLLATLEEERDALSSGEVTKIDTCGQRKSDCVTMLEDLERERTQVCRMLSLTDTNIDQYLVEHDPDATPNAWKKFCSSLEKCREANTFNGTLTRMRRGHIEKALHILRGGADNTPALYGPDGMDAVNDVTSLGQA